jgi:hypothetical protein
MHQPEIGAVGVRIIRHRRWAMAVVLAGGLALAACSSSSTGSPSTTTTPSGGSATTSAGGSSSGLSSVVNRISSSSVRTFSTTYQINANGQNQTITFAQAPPKSAVITPSGSFYISGSSITECQGSDSSATCTSLPSGLTNTLSGLTDLFSPTSLSTTLKGLETLAAAKAGVSVSSSSATYGGLRSTCFTLSKSSGGSSFTYCAADSNGILTYSSAAGSTVTLASYSASPPSSTFSPPAGATINTIPGGA